MGSSSFRIIWWLSKIKVDLVRLIDIIYFFCEPFNNAQLFYRGESVLRGKGDDSYYKVDLRVNFKARENKYDCLLLSLLKTRIFVSYEVIT